MDLRKKWSRKAVRVIENSIFWIFPLEILEFRSSFVIFSTQKRNRNWKTKQIKTTKRRSSDCEKTQTPRRCQLNQSHDRTNNEVRLQNIEIRNPKNKTTITSGLDEKHGRKTGHCNARQALSGHDRTDRTWQNMARRHDKTAWQDDVKGRRDRTTWHGMTWARGHDRTCHGQWGTWQDRRVTHFWKLTFVVICRQWTFLPKCFFASRSHWAAEKNRHRNVLKSNRKQFEGSESWNRGFGVMKWPENEGTQWKFGRRVITGRTQHEKKKNGFQRAS